MQAQDRFRYELIRHAAKRGETADIGDLGLNEIEIRVARYAAGLIRSYSMNPDEAITKATPRVFSQQR